MVFILPRNIIIAVFAFDSDEALFLVCFIEYSAKNAESFWSGYDEIAGNVFRKITKNFYGFIARFTKVNRTN